MQIIIRNIPNLITLGNLFCGLISISFAFSENLYYAGMLIIFGSIFDFLDGLTARFLKVQSEIGKQLDGFSDMTTFGIAPGILLFQMIYISQTGAFYNESIINQEFFISLFAFLIPIFSAIRLAKYNTDTRQGVSFIGLPTPAAAIFISSLPIISYQTESEYFNNTISLIMISIILSTLLISHITTFSFKKDISEDIKLYYVKLFFLIISVILIILFKLISIPFIIILYILLSIIHNMIK